MLVFPVESEVEASSVSPKDQQRTRVYSFPSDVTSPPRHMKSVYIFVLKQKLLTKSYNRDI
jgi:hypothetical protein